MATMEEMEKKARDYNVARGALVELVNGLNNEIEVAKKLYMKSIRKQVAATKEAESALEVMVAQSAAQFARPKSVVLHGIRFGFRKGKGKLKFDAKKIVTLIEKHLPTLAEVLIKTEKKPVKAAISKLSGDELKKIGASLTEAGDQAFVEVVDGEVDKIVTALLENNVQDEES